VSPADGPPRRFYPRAEPYRVVETLHALAQVLRTAGWEERGGHLLRDEHGEVSGRTKWVPRAQWWAERPHSFSEQQCAGIVLKLLRGGTLTKREAACMAHLITIVDTGGEDDGRGDTR
jgi:hypothetical protein